MKRYAIVKVPEGAYDATVRFYSDADSDMDGTTIGNSGIINGPVELMEAACKEVGVRLRIPEMGDWVMYGDGTWHTVVVESYDWDIRPVIPAPEPEPETPCPNCQGIGGAAPLMATITDTGWTCMKCGRPESEWTYAPTPTPDPGGIGGGGTGGPL